MEKAVAALAALAQESRLALFRLLVQTGEEGMPAGALAQDLGIPNSSLSFHLAQLMKADLIKQERRSRSLIYSANYPEVDALIDYLTENCRGAFHKPHGEVTFPSRPNERPQELEPRAARLLPLRNRSPGFGRSSS